MRGTSAGASAACEKARADRSEAQRLCGDATEARRVAERATELLKCEHARALARRPPAARGHTRRSASVPPWTRDKSSEEDQGALIRGSCCDSSEEDSDKPRGSDCEVDRLRCELAGLRSVQMQKVELELRVKELSRGDSARRRLVLEDTHRPTTQFVNDFASLVGGVLPKVVERQSKGFWTHTHTRERSVVESQMDTCFQRVAIELCIGTDR